MSFYDGLKVSTITPLAHHYDKLSKRINFAGTLFAKIATL
jgi:hypothetical protein